MKRFGGCMVALLFAPLACGGRIDLEPGLFVGGSGGSGTANAHGGQGGGTQPNRGGSTSGGTLNTGGVGRGGGPSTGGSPGTGGFPNFGGFSGTGGRPATGGFPSFGGFPATGGRPNVGGSPATGGLGQRGGAPGQGGSGGSSPCSQCRADNECEIAVCDSVSGACLRRPAPPGTSCDDHDFCTVNDRCIQGRCAGGEPRSCAGSLPCAAVVCDSGRGACVRSIAPEGERCKSDDLCITDGKCISGKCVGQRIDCPSPTDCFAASCNPLKGTCEYSPTVGNRCGDISNRCMIGICNGGACAVDSFVDCSFLNGPCTVGSCDPNTGSCTATPLPNNTPCSLGACRRGDVCVDGSCVFGKPVTECRDNDGCCGSGCTAADDSDCTSVSVVLDAVHRGWWSNGTLHQSTNLNTYTGSLYPNLYNSYFIFDLGAVKGRVLSATLILEQENYFGSDPSEPASVWDVATPAEALNANGSSALIFDDLQSGNQYAAFVATPADTGRRHVIVLNEQAINDLNAARGGSFAVGVHLDALRMTRNDEAVRFSELSEPRVHQLQLNVK